MSLTVEGHAIDTRIVTMPRVDGEGLVSESSTSRRR